MANITKRDLVEKIANATGLTQVDTMLVFEMLIEAIKKSLANGNNIEIRGFGRFKIKKRNARKARNPHTGETVLVSDGYKPFFAASRELIRRVNSKWMGKSE